MHQYHVLVKKIRLSFVGAMIMLHERQVYPVTQQRCYRCTNKKHGKRFLMPAAVSLNIIPLHFTGCHDQLLQRECKPFIKMSEEMKYVMEYTGDGYSLHHIA